MRVAALLGMMLLVGCLGGMPGTRVPRARPGAAVTTSTTSDPGGVRVLAYTPVRTRRGSTLLAANRAELSALWFHLALEGPPPVVDFSTHIVIGTSFAGGTCDINEIVAAHVDASGTLTLDERGENAVDASGDAIPDPEDGLVGCAGTSAAIAKVVALPRALVGARFAWPAQDEDIAYAFTVPPAPAPASAGAAPAAPGSIERPAIAAPRGVVELPPRGHIAARSLDDGRAVWVVHRVDGDISVVLADTDGRYQGLRTSLPWVPRTGRFRSRWDSRGRSAFGERPLATLAFARIDASRIAVGEPAALPDGPIEPRAAAPVLDGPRDPYRALAPAAFDAIPDGRFGSVASDVIFGVDGPPRLCTLPTGKLVAYLPGCPASAPALVGGRSEQRYYRWTILGPLAVRRRGSGADVVIELGRGEGAMVVERRLHAPAPHGPTRDRGALRVGATATGDTRGARDGFVPPCIPAEAGGGPDESWTLVAPEAGRYAIELTGDRDGVLAAVADDGRVLACNDDRYLGKRDPLLHVALTAGQTIRVIVDAFSGEDQRYRLRATLERGAAPDASEGHARCQGALPCASP